MSEMDTATTTADPQGATVADADRMEQAAAGQMPAKKSAGPLGLGQVLCLCATAAAWLMLILSESGEGLSLVPKSLLILLGLGLPIVAIVLDPVQRAIADRELQAYFYSPVGYVVLAVFTVISSFFFVTMVFQPGAPIDLTPLFLYLVLWVLIPLSPAISMRLFSEELRSGNLEALVTAPITDVQLFLGKWLGAFGFLVITLTISLLLIILLEVYGEPDYGPIFTGYVGLLLMGALFLAIGAFTSVLTQNQIISYLISVMTLAVLVYLNLVLTNNYVSGRWATAMKYVNPYEHYRNFALGMLDAGDFVYLVSGTVLFLVLGVKALESRKWR